jgi:hypothetical protein
MDDVPAAVADILRGRNMQAVIHLPPGSADEQLPWQSAPGLTRESSPPGPDDAALALAPYAIAETGTLAYTSAPDAPASWHFRAGLEIAVLRCGFDPAASGRGARKSEGARRVPPHAQSRDRPFAHGRHRADPGTRRPRPEGVGDFD